MADMRRDCRMRGRRMAALKGRLLMRRNDLLQRVEGLERAGTSPGVMADETDQALESSSAEIELRIAEMQSGEIASIEEALHKLSNGTYGICECCGRPIPATRLRLLPNATTCVSCRQAEEKERTNEEGMPHEWEDVSAEAEPPARGIAANKF